jgi:hypothetical protein
VKAEISVNEIGNGSLKLDGVDVSKAVRGFELSSRVGQVTTLLIDLVVAADADGEVALKPDVHELLIDLGWTPPGDGAA